MKTQVKFITGTSMQDLEVNVNDFLNTLTAVELSISYRSVFMNGPMHWSAMIVYKG